MDIVEIHLGMRYETIYKITPEFFKISPDVRVIDCDSQRGQKFPLLYFPIKSIRTVIRQAGSPMRERSCKIFTI
jgi:hypothetical protein